VFYTTGFIAVLVLIPFEHILDSSNKLVSFPT